MRLRIFGFLLSIALLGTSSARAGDPRIGFGLNAGGGYSLGVIGASGTGIGATYCFGVTWRPNELFGYALEFAGYGGTDTTVGLLPASTSFTEVSLHGNAYFKKKLYAGVSLGLQAQTLSTTTLFTGTVVSSGVSIAPHVGYLYDLEEGFTFSPELSVHASFASSMVLWTSVIFRLGYTL